ncbi:ABC transporter permease [Amycolatopsis circi]|uniref:ABC transporter permease n=1 Tax=Amycolatopsis circi TaxID=871959 RepID=UPI000E23836A|nr:ABC transporter permease [Amycolatopsis circi]
MPALVRLAATETKLFFREPIVVFFALAFSPILFVVLGLIPALREPGPDGVRMISRYLPIVVAMGVSLFSLSGLSQLFASYREKGVLRRMRLTPVKPTVMLGAQSLMAVVLSAASTLVILVLGRLAFDVDLPRRLPAYVLSFMLLALALFGIGLLVAALARSAKSASAVGSLVFFPLVFFAGLWVPRASMNQVLLTISDLTPLGAGVQALQDTASGNWPQLLHLGVMLGWLVVAGGLAARYFRWE